MTSEMLGLIELFVPLINTQASALSFPVPPLSYGRILSL